MYSSLKGSIAFRKQLFYDYKPKLKKGGPFEMLVSHLRPFSL